MNLFNILRVKDSINNIENKISLPYELPPLYKMFLTIFDIESSQFFSENFIYENSQIDGFNLFYLKLKEFNLQIHHFYNQKDLADDFDAYLIDDEIYYNLKLVRIGMHELGGGIMLGCDPKSNFDEIFIYFWDDLQLIRCASNIFEFISLIHSEIDQYQIESTIKSTSNLYKNWGEDFWRIKPTEFRDARPYELLDNDALDKKYHTLKKSGADLYEIESEYRTRGIELPKKFLFW